MKYTRLGTSDLNISRICLGCLSFGDASLSNNPEWLLNQEKTDQIVGRALELGVNFFDTANYYNEHTSEIFLGNALKKLAKREDVVIATKVYYNEGGLSREAIRREIDNSLKRLQTDYVDLYVIHRYDENVPIEETMEALNEVVESGKARYIGASTMYSYQFMKAQETARHHGWKTFISMQNHYNLIYREEEREMMKLLAEEHVQMTPYSPLAAGRLARPWESESLRSKTDHAKKQQEYERNKESDYGIVMRVKELAERHNANMAQIALAWMHAKEIVAAPVIGATKMKHLEDAAASVDLSLNKEEIQYLEELYVPHNVF